MIIMQCATGAGVRRPRCGKEQRKRKLGTRGEQAGAENLHGAFSSQCGDCVLRVGALGFVEAVAVAVARRQRDAQWRTLRPVAVKVSRPSLNAKRHQPAPGAQTRSPPRAELRGQDLLWAK